MRRGVKLNAVRAWVVLPLLVERIECVYVDPEESSLRNRKYLEERDIRRGIPRAYKKGLRERVCAGAWRVRHVACTSAGQRYEHVVIQIVGVAGGKGRTVRAA